MTEHLSQIQREWRLVHDAYHRGLREGLSQGPAHPAVQRSVANMFYGWDGADNALQRSTQRFWQRVGGDRHEA